jgi:ATP-binding cassette subfamily F protein 3
MILLDVCDVSKRFGPEPVLENVSLEVRPGEKWGLVGPNGAGKTTLLKMLAGQLEPDSGSIELHSSARLEYLEQQPEFTPGRTLWDETASALEDLTSLQRDAERVAQALGEATDPADRQKLAQRFDRLQHELSHRDAYNLEHRIERVLAGLGFESDSFARPVEVLSGGQQNRLLLAKLLLREPDVLLLDEPSNHLDIEATEWLETFLAESRQAMVVVSHDRYFLDRVATGILELYKAEIDTYPGNFSAYWEQKAERLKVQSRTYEKQQTLIAKTEDFIRRNHYGQKATQAEDRRKKLERIEQVRAPRSIVGPAMSFPPADRTGDIVVRAEHLTKGYDGTLFSDLSFDVLRGERWGILGANGTGKSTLLRLVVGQEQPDAGQVVLGTGVRTGYYDQMLAGLDDELPVVEAIRPPGKEFNEPERRALLAKFGLQGDAVFRSVKALSGGERSRAALARLSAADPNFLVLDEPTNHLDLWACDALERALVEFEGTLLFVSHDRYFLDRVADHLLAVEGDRFRIITGNYETYRYAVRNAPVEPEPAKRLATKQPATKVEEPEAGRGGRTKPAKPKRKFPYRKVADIEAEIFEREQRIEALHAQLISPEVLRDGRRTKEAQAELTSEQEQLRTLYEHWEEASETN